MTRSARSSPSTPSAVRTRTPVTVRRPPSSPTALVCVRTLTRWVFEYLFADDEVGQVAACGDQIVGGAPPTAVPALGGVDDRVGGNRYAVGTRSQQEFNVAR